MNFLEIVHSILDNIKFTEEMESTEHIQSFLDYAVEIKQNDCLELNIFRKITELEISTCYFYTGDSFEEFKKQSSIVCH